MSKRQVTKVKVEVEMTLPVGKRPQWGVNYVGELLAAADKTRTPHWPVPVAVHTRLLSKETTYL